MQIHTYRGGVQNGPHSLEEIQAKLDTGALSLSDLAWYEGAKDWMPLSQLPGLKLPAVPPPLPTAKSMQPDSPMPTSRKGLLIAGGVGTIILALVLLGVATTYLGRPGSGFLDLILIPLSIGVGAISIQFFSALSRNPTGCCRVCGQPKRTLNGSLHRHVGAVILMFHARITGHMCKDCIGGVFWRFTPVTLAAGWWGLISFFVTPVVLVNNIAYYVRSRLTK